MIMKKLSNKIFLGLIATFLCCNNTFSQQVKGRIEAPQNGWQTITVPQEFRARIGYDAGKLRIKDQKGNEVPYILKPEQAEKTDFKPVVYSKISNPADSTESVLIDNSNKQQKQSYTFKIANTSVRKSYSIEGSNGQQSWFSLVSQGYIDQMYNDEQTYTTKSISFPRTDYRFIRITFNNKSSLPINILDVGEIETNVQRTSYEKLRNVSFKLQNDKQHKISLLSISKDHSSPVDYIRLHISTSLPYHREAELYIPDTQPHTHKTYDRTLAYFTLHSGNQDGFAIDPVLDSEFYIKIFNEDNPPLQIDSISLFQKPIQILTNLKQGFTYSLEADSNWHTPNYDLAKTELQLPDSLPQAQVKAIEIWEKPAHEAKNKYGNFILISCSIIGVLILFYFGSSLLKDMKKKE